MTEGDDTPITEEERVLAARGAEAIARAVASPEAQAPARLRESLEAQRGGARTRRARSRLGWLGVLAGGVAAVVIAVVVISGGSGGPGGPSVFQVAAVARLAPTKPAPSSVGGLQPKLEAEVSGVPFPDWRQEFDWEATGRRDDTVDGRSVTTVTYRNRDGVELAYAIVDGDALPAPDAGREIQRRGFSYRVVRRDERTVVTWEEQGHTCVIDAPGTVPSGTLVDLAAWDNV
ncbi:hypothetical protein [Paraconexibacter sp.]|uniref:hypothetical protein n=1 Tax=Paraconexibacter sp. TaxID=2949640 RepID=UPI003568FBF4